MLMINRTEYDLLDGFTGKVQLCISNLKKGVYLTKKIGTFYLVNFNEILIFFPYYFNIKDLN